MQNRVQVIVYLLCTVFILLCFLYESVTRDTVWSLHAMVAQRRKRTHTGPENKTHTINSVFISHLDRQKYS